MPVREVPAVREIHSQDHVAGLNHGRVSRLVGLRTRVRLDVGVFGAEKLFGSLTRQSLYRVREFASTVVALTRVSLGIFVGENLTGGLQDRFGGEVFAGDQLQTAVLPFRFVLDRVKDFRVNAGKRARHPLGVVHKF